MLKPRLLDLFCKAGGATRGYQLAGFHVAGVDIQPQRNYVGDEFFCGDALEYLKIHGSEFDAIAASPPCQRFSAMTKRWGRESTHPDLIEPTRELLLNFGVPFVIENVVGAPLRNPLMLCGTMFGLGTKEGSQLRRHRLFELGGFSVPQPECAHNDGSAIGVYGGGQHPQRRRPATILVFGNAGGSSVRDGIQHYGVSARRDAMGIDWMTGKELSQAIPPAYTEFIGRMLREMIGK